MIGDGLWRTNFVEQKNNIIGCGDAIRLGASMRMSLMRRYAISSCAMNRAAIGCWVRIAVSGIIMMVGTGFKPTGRREFPRSRMLVHWRRQGVLCRWVSLV